VSRKFLIKHEIRI